jgi:predicted AAA+ superfamily ATPase
MSNVDLTAMPVKLVAGPRQSGRTTLLVERIVAGLRVGESVLIVAPNMPQLHDLRERVIEELGEEPNTVAFQGAVYNSRNLRGIERDLVVFDNIDQVPERNLGANLSSLWTVGTNDVVVSVERSHITPVVVSGSGYVVYGTIDAAPYFHWKFDGRKPQSMSGPNR